MMTFVRGECSGDGGRFVCIGGRRCCSSRCTTIVEDLGANAFVIEERKKVLYHAFGSFASPLVIALLASMEQVAAAAGIRQAGHQSDHDAAAVADIA